MESKMKETREIDVLVYSNGLKNCIGELQKAKSWINVFHPDNPALKKSEMVKAKLVIELPEKEATITESEFDEFITNCFTQEWIKDEMVTIKNNLFNRRSK
jgi:hypothetical protein